MYCASCGHQIPDGSSFCNYCRQPVSGQVNNNMNYQQANQYRANGSGNQYAAQNGINIDNIFSALVREKSTGVIMEFVLWCVSCVAILFSLIVAIVAYGRLEKSIWFFVMFFSIGYAVLAAMRMKPILMFYSIIAFNLITCGIHFIVSENVSRLYAWSDYLYGLDFLTGYERRPYSPLNITIFTFAVMTTIAAIVCAGLHFFTKRNMGKITTILVIVSIGIYMLLHILVFALPYIGEGAGSFRSAARSGLVDGGYWYGTICLWMMLIVIMLHYIFFFWGAMDSTNDKIGNVNKTGKKAVDNRRIPAPSGFGVRGVFGIHAGETFLLNNGMITIGSASNMTIVIPFVQISKQHCAIRYNNGLGCYEVYDNSTNGVYLSSGAPLQKGTYNRVRRGEIIYIGDNKEQYMLL